MSYNAAEELSNFIFQSKYSKFIPDLNRKETFEESINRIDSMHTEHLFNNYPNAFKNSEFANDYIECIEAYKQKKILGSQRGLQFGGTPILKNNCKLFNCSFTYIDRLEVFKQIEWVLLCGCGVGISVEKQHIDKLPTMCDNLSSEVYTHVISDDIEGWAEAFDAIITYYFNCGSKYPKFDYSKIRPKGAYITGGFKAPGPDGLRKSIVEVEKVLDNIWKNNKDKRLTSLNCTDIISHLADSVLSGGLRRSALIVLFDHDDEEMINCKTGNWFYNNPQRARFNMSAALDRDTIKYDDFIKIFKATKEFGEPGFFFRSNSGVGPNPCCEIGFKPVDKEGNSGFSFCNLVTINGGNIENEEDFYERCKHAATIATVQASYMDFSFLGQPTLNIVKEDPLIGVSIAGEMNTPDILLVPKIQQKGAEIVKNQNEKIAKILNINVSSRTTCIKPDGNTSVLLGITPGCHGEHAKHYIRRVQVNKTEEAGITYKKYNPDAVVESVWSSNHTDDCIMFPITAKEGSIFKSELLGIKQLEVVKNIFENWIISGMRDPNSTIQNNVSNTVTVPNDQWDEVANYIWDNKNIFAGISFIPQSGDMDYNQPPYTEVLMPDELLEQYGEGVIFASGLIVDTNNVFNNLWEACDCFTFKGEKISASEEDIDNFLNDLYNLNEKEYRDKPLKEYQQAKANQYIMQYEVLTQLGYSDEFIDELLDNEMKIPRTEIKKYLNNTMFSKDVSKKREIMKRFQKFSDKYFESNDTLMLHALKHVQLFHDWCDLTRNNTSIDWTTVKWKNEFTSIDETAAATCSGGACEINKI